MAWAGNIRHPMYSIGEGVGLEKEERLKKQGLLKKSVKPIEPMSSTPIELSTDNIWDPSRMLNFDNLIGQSKSNQSKNIKDKIY